MSSISRWSYRNIATVWPYVSEDLENGGTVFGVPYTIACTWTRKAEQRRDANGAEFISRDTFWTEDARPQYRDYIAKLDQSGNPDPISAGAAEIRTVTDWDMSCFSEADSPDYELVT